MPTSERPLHLRRLYSAYENSRALFARELADIYRAHSRFQSWSEVSVLDLGSGSGGISREFAEIGANVTAIEYNLRRVLGMAQEKLRFRLIAGDGHFLPFRSRSFDFVILADVLEHVGNAGAMMREVARVARPGALVFVGATNRTSIVNLIFDPHYNVPLIPLLPKRLATWYVTNIWKVSGSFNVERYFFRRELVQLIHDAGFSCQGLPLYQKKLETSDLAAAPGRGLIRKMLKVPFIRNVAMWSSGTSVFEHFIAPGFNFLCRRDDTNNDRDMEETAASGNM